MFQYFLESYKNMFLYEYIFFFSAGFAKEQMKLLNIY